MVAAMFGAGIVGLVLNCCCCLQAEAKKLEDASTYLSLPSTKAELEEKGHSVTGKSLQGLGSCSISKDSFQISTLVCSTKLTQNGASPPPPFPARDGASLWGAPSLRLPLLP